LFDTEPSQLSQSAERRKAIVAQKGVENKSNLVKIDQTDWLAAAGLMLALRWPPGHWPLDAGFWTLVPSDAGCHRHWSLSALVVFGSKRTKVWKNLFSKEQK
jgi:hypothetical protein